MNITKATEKYEAWLGKQLKLIPSDLKIKHVQMRSAVFPFLRATFYRWAQIWEDVCGDAARAPEVLAVGDLHVENFGTWRDAEGRLVWGINDFDEAFRLPYTNDLIRLATSALISGMLCDGPTATEAILKGYRESLEMAGRPFVLAEQHPSLRHMATARLHDAQLFWNKLQGLRTVREVPAPAAKAIERLMPERGMRWRTVHRIAGLGSLGRQRFVALADWHGGAVAREAKALAPSACVWAMKRKSAPILYQRILDVSVRCRDPFVRLRDEWIVRRLAPDCSRIELAALPRERDELRLLKDMGWDTANVHLGTASARILLADLKKRPAGWLLEAAQSMAKAVKADFAAYRKTAAS